ncbi:MAG TPA: NADH-quinone oxidoreductase subunit B family protein [archaeon]|nr:NADH-quinone oxidoreductase subunit B family protein [archaeon]
MKNGLRQRAINACRKKSVWILPFNSGGCNGCAIEVLACMSPRSDVERFGILVKGSPRHADVLVVDGPVTSKLKDRLLRIYHQMPQPKVVVALGSCTASNGIFDGCYGVAGPLDKIIPVDVWVPGCPPRPEAIIQGIIKAMGKIEGLER